MHRRARHLNARHAGAGLVLDARRLTGLNDGDAVSTWNDVSGNGWNATGTSTARPLYKTAIQGGQPALLFDGVNDMLGCADVGALGYTKDRGYIYAFAIVIDSAPASGDAEHHVLFISTPAAGARTCIRTRNVSASGLVFVGRRLDADSFLTSPSAGAASSFCSVVARHVPASQVASVSKNGVNASTVSFSSAGNTSNTASSVVTIGSVSNGAASRLSGYIGYIAVIASQLSASLIKRLDHSNAFSFKIQCS